MSVPADAGVVDLRSAWISTLPRAFDSAGEGEGGDTSQPPDPAPADQAEDDTDAEQLTEEEIRNPRLKQLSDENAKHRIKNKELTDQLSELQTWKQQHEGTLADLTAVLRDARMDAAFVRAGYGKFDDLDAAWKLADKTGVTMNDDGTIAGMDAVVTQLLDRYPYLRTEDPEPWTPPPDEPSGRRTSGRRAHVPDPNRTLLEEKFPALRGRR